MISLYLGVKIFEVRSRLHEIRALVPPNTPYTACTATATKSVKQEVIGNLEMRECEFVYTSPDRPNIFYEVQPRTDIETDVQHLVQSLCELANKAPCVIVYCRSLNSCRSVCTFPLCVRR